MIWYLLSKGKTVMSFKPYSHKKEKPLPLFEINRLNDIFIQKGWPKETSFNNHVFDNFCKTLAKYTSEQRDLILTLTEKFIWIRPENYTSYFDKVFSDFISSYEKKFDPKSKPKSQFILCPLLSEQDLYKVKSSTTLLYLIKGQLKAMQNKYSKYDIVIKELPIPERIKESKFNTTVCLVDDFLGTGQTAKAAVSNLENKGIDKEKIVVLVLVGMKEGIKYLVSQGITVFAYLSCDKGITGHEKDTELLNIMDEIEKKICVVKTDKLGYNSSEALVRMIRTPNNTFPFFWLCKKDHEAPFPR